MFVDWVGLGVGHLGAHREREDLASLAQSPVDSGEDCGVGAAAVGIEDFCDVEVGHGSCAEARHVLVG